VKLELFFCLPSLTCLRDEHFSNCSCICLEHLFDLLHNFNFSRSYMTVLLSTVCCAIGTIVGHVGDGNFHTLLLCDVADADEMSRAKSLANTVST